MKRFVAILLALVTGFAAFSQELRLVVEDKSLSDVLPTLGVEISFDEQALLPYRIRVSQTFASPEQALEFLLQDKPFGIRKVGAVFVIFPFEHSPETVHTSKERASLYSGTVYDAENGEKLPYGYLLCGRNIYPCDQAGRFSFQRQTGEAVPVRIVYLGYHPVDTIVSPGFTSIALLPSPVVMKNIEVRPLGLSMMMQGGITSGQMRINHRLARYMPGSPDNSVFSLLRMMPGVRASGEPSEDLVVWGSGPGESKISFDGYTLFGMKNFNDHIGSVNPYLVKDIRLMKGGYGVENGGRVGATAQISAIDGETSQPVFRSMISNYTANLYASVPVLRNSVLSAAYRQTFYNLYSDRSYELTNQEQGAWTKKDVYIRPRYHFRDGNLRFSGKGRSGDRFSLSLYAADDRFEFGVDNRAQYAVDAREKNYQLAGAAAYQKSWEDGGSSRLSLSYSSFFTQSDNVTGTGEGAEHVLVVSHTDNSIQEYQAQIAHTFPAGEKHRLKAGGEWTFYVNHLNREDYDVNVPSVYLTDNLSLGRLSGEAGLRADFPWKGRAAILPRVSARYRLSDPITLTASWGMYRQYISKIPYQYSTGHHELIWSLSDSTFMRSSQAVAGAAYSKNGLLVSLEGFWRQTHNGIYFRDNAVFASDNTVTGVDVLARKQFSGTTVFMAYSLAYMRKPLTETSHELKIGGLTQWGSFFFSTHFVYGAGFSYLSTAGHSHTQQPQGAGTADDGHSHTNDNENHSYFRLDGAVTYRLKKEKWQMQAGVSLINVFDTRNIKYSYRLNDLNNVANIYTKATPFTPVVSAEILF